MIGANEIIVIVVLLLIFLGPTKIPEFAKMIVEASKGIRQGIDGKTPDDKKINDDGSEKVEVKIVKKK